MDERHKTIIRKSRTVIVSNLEDIGGVCDRLMALSTLTPNMNEEILSETTREYKIRKLLDILPRRGSTAYDCFHQALVDTGNQYLANVLRPEMAGEGYSLSLKINKKKATLTRSSSVPSPGTTTAKLHVLDIKSHWKSSESAIESTSEDYPEFVVPTGWPRTVDHNPLNINIKPSRIKPDNSVYRMINNRCHGNVILVINHEYNHVPSPQEVKDKLNLDASSLQLLFRKLNFHVKTHWNVTIKKLTDIVGKESTSDHSEVDCFILIIISQGKGDVILGTEGQTLKLDNLIGCFDGEHCPSLEGKPKIFMVQACEEVSQSTESWSEDVIGEESLLTMVSDIQEPSGTISRRDIFIARATIDRPVEYHSPFGSYFVQAFVYIMTNTVHTDDIEAIFEKVNRLAVSGQQVPGLSRIVEYSSSLTKKFYFSLDTNE